ncbi:hypothetical protein BJ912DRAFT_852992, partial [Pholiota molesta]
QYTPPMARAFTSDEIAHGSNKVNLRTTVDAIIDHPLNMLVEYPETGREPEYSVGHRFAIDPQDFINPRFNIQFSLGDSHGGHSNVPCRLLIEKTTGKAAICKNTKYGCKGIKRCEFAPEQSIILGPKPATRTAAEEVFQKTLAFYCVLLNKGCLFDAEDGLLPPHELRSPTKKHCQGEMIMRSNKYGRPFIQCEHRTNSDRSHLIIRNLDEFNTFYLKALLDADHKVISCFENEAKLLGYGPLIPCTYTASASAQKALCPYWHRFSSNQLQRGSMERCVDKGEKACQAMFSIYEPNDPSACPFILIICKGPHTHIDPFPVKTPPSILMILSSLLVNMGWRLADATPRNIMLDSGFMNGLKQHLAWRNDCVEPVLSDLHPSLGNSDHVRRYINDLRAKQFPRGTGFEGAQLLVEQQLSGPEELQYVRCAEMSSLPDGKEFFLVICMSRAMSAYLMSAKFLSIDTAFKRLQHKWQEFEIETWDVDRMRSVVSVRAFTTSQSADAHLVLFTRIFEIAECDTGSPVQFNHIHGQGFLGWIADAHMGQALGLGLYCQQLCAEINGYCSLETPIRQLSTLNPYDHLRRFFRQCVAHFKRKVQELGSQISPEVKAAMLSLASAEPHPDLDGAFEIIENGGPKAKAWLKDKRVTNKFALPGLYQPLSLIPLNVWKASPSTTNGNEQAHRNINRDGMNLTVLGGIMLGMQYDFRATASRELHKNEGIYTGDQEATHFRRIARSVNRQGIVSNPTIGAE